MTLGEFKAFIEGMDVKGRPTEEQWSRIISKLDQLEAPLSYKPYDLPTIMKGPNTNPYTYNTCGKTYA